MTTNEINAIAQAFKQGLDWVKNLQVGDTFAGARPEAESRYLDERQRHMFVQGALIALDAFHVWTSCDTNVITRKAPAA